MKKNSQKIILAIAMCGLLVFPIFNIPQARADSPTGVMIPLYSYPTNVSWSNLIAAKNAHPDVPVVAIINPSSGPGSSQNQTFLNGINNLKSAGIVVLGYIPTNYAKRTLSSVESDIDKYKNWYPVDGVKFDEMTNTSGYESYYSSLTGYAKSKGFSLVVGNPGADVPGSYIGVVDNISIFENGYLPSLSYLGGWHTSYDKSNFSAESYNITTLDTSFVTSASQYVGFIYLTNDNLPNPWDTLSVYINDLLATLEAANGPTLDSSQTVLTSNINPSTVGQSITLTATVNGSSGTPTGSVTFRDGAVFIGSGNLSGGLATMTTSSLGAGTHNLTGFYSGNSNYAPSTSSIWIQTVNKALTTTIISSDLNPAQLGESITFTATVSGSGGIPTGSVTFRDGITNIGTGTLSSNAATFSTSNLSGGSHNISAVYGGDSNFAASSSGSLIQNVETPSLVGTSTSLSSNTNPSVSGQSITFSATVTGAGGTPSGHITFREGVTTLGTGNLVGGSSTFSTNILSVGLHNINAIYSGDSTFDSSTSTTLVQTVNKGDTSTSVSSNANPILSGQSVTFTATLNSVLPSSGALTGSVVFYDGITNIGTIQLSGNTAALVISSLSVGSHNISAAYSGDAHFNGSDSTTISQTVNTAPLANSSTSISSNANPSVRGQAVTFTAIVSGSNGTPTGTVTFNDGSTVLGTSSLSGNVASFTSTQLSVGLHSMTASYGGNSVYNTSSSSILTQTVNKGNTITTLSSSNNPSSPGQTVTLTVSVSLVSPASGTRMGNVTFLDGSTTIGIIPLTSNTATLNISFSGGSHSITANYSGDTNFNSSSNSLTQFVGKSPTSTALSTSQNPSKWRQFLSLTAIVTSPNDTPAGNVSFFDGGVLLGTGILSGNSVTYTTSSLSEGAHSIIAVYDGDDLFNSSTSSTLQQIIYKGNPNNLALSSTHKHEKI